METITCGNCDSVIATGESRADAVENAFVDNMDHNYNQESSEWECATCYHTRVAEAKVWYDSEHRVFEAELAARQFEEDNDNFLASVDMIRDLMDKGIPIMRESDD